MCLKYILSKKVISIYTVSGLVSKVVNKAKKDTRKECSPPPPHPSLSALARSDAYTKKNIFLPNCVELTKANKGLYPFSIEVNERGKTII